jgi:hypothetical protein
MTLGGRPSSFLLSQERSKNFGRYILGYARFTAGASSASLGVGGVARRELVVSLGRDPLDGRYRQLSRTVGGTKREEQRALAELITEVSAGRETGANATVADLLAQWLDLAADQLSPTTLRTYQQIVRTRLGPAIGSVRVRKLRAQQLDQLYGALIRDGKLSPTTVRQVHSVIRRALAQAVRWGWVPVNVAAATSRRTPRRTRSANSRSTSTRSTCFTRTKAE